jgi:tetratricopeptide (TPR) repeat protein
MPPHRAIRESTAARKRLRRERRWLQPLLLILAAALLLCVFSGEIRDTDVWWHLKTGQHTFQAHALPVPDPFSYTTAMSRAAYPGEEVTRHFNLTHEWLSQIVMYLIYSAAGFPGLVLARALLLTIFCGLVGWLAYRRTGEFYLGLAAALAAAGIAFHFSQSRPFLATFVFLAVTLAVLESRRRVWLLPPLFLVWANCHSGFFTGWLLLGAYCAEAVFLRWRGRPVPRERELWLVAALSILASGLNPNGFGVVRVLWLYRMSGIQTNNLEWQRPMFWEPGIYSLLLFGAFLALLIAFRRARPVDWLLYLGFAAISLMAVRNTMFLGLVGPLVIATYVSRRWGTPIILTVLSAAGLLVYDVAPAVASGNVLALRAAEWQLPSGAADFIQAHRITGRMFNGYENGGYLVWRLWPLQRDFIDSRGMSEAVYGDYMRILTNPNLGGANGAEKLFQKYGIEMLLLDGFDYLSGSVYPLAVQLVESPQAEWKLAYTDSKGVIFMRHPPPDVEPLKSQALFESLEAQCGQHISHDPGRPRCAFGLGELYAHIGDQTQARRWMGFYLDRRNGPDPEAEQIYESLNVKSITDEALSLESKGDLAGAEPLFRRALAIAEKDLGPDSPDTAGSLNNLAGLLESKGDLAEAEVLYRRVLTICEKTLGPDDPHTVIVLDNLAGLLESKGDLVGAEPLYLRALAAAEKALGRDDPSTRRIREELASLLRKRVR